MTGATVAQGQANKDAAIAGAQLSNPNFTNPYGSRRVEYRNDPTTGNPVPFITDSYSTEQKQLLDTGLQTQQAMGDLGLQGINKARGILGQQFDVGSIPGIENTTFDRNSVRDALLARTNEDYTRDLDAKESQLVAQGIPKGSKAWDYEMQRLDRARNDARRTAEVSVGSMQQQELDARRQMITEALANRQTPLNEISALRSGSQVQPLSFQNYSGQNVAPTPFFAAAQAQATNAQQNYQNEVGANNAMISGIAGIGGAALGSPAMASTGKPWWMG